MKPIAMIKCNKCNFYKLINKEEELSVKDIFEYPRSCSACGSKRKFRCPTCGNQIKLINVRS